MGTFNYLDLQLFSFFVVCVKKISKNPRNLYMRMEQSLRMEKKKKKERFSPLFSPPVLHFLN